ncbi:hypothetical protein LXA43DRAFT_1015078 [Ganoderma leucocontextum]|nr:hypothetical protein LXA43DRAFT_1015078 [Ganoderma leucocontextum]
MSAAVYRSFVPLEPSIRSLARSLHCAACRHNSTLSRRLMCIPDDTVGCSPSVMPWIDAPRSQGVSSALLGISQAPISHSKSPNNGYSDYYQIGACVHGDDPEQIQSRRPWVESPYHRLPFRAVRPQDKCRARSTHGERPRTRRLTLAGVSGVGMIGGSWGTTSYLCRKLEYGCRRRLSNVYRGVRDAKGRYLSDRRLAVVICPGSGSGMPAHSRYEYQLNVSVAGPRREGDSS